MADQVYSLAINWDAKGQFCTNVLHYRFDDSAFNSTFGAAQSLTNSFIAAKVATLLDMVPDSVTLLSMRARRVSAIGGLECTTLIVAGTTGTRTGPMAVAGVGPCIVLYEIANGKRRGRIFLPGITESDCNMGVIIGSAQANLVTKTATLIGNLTLVGGGAPTAHLCIYHRQTHTGFLLDGAGPSLTVATQRRRQLPV